MRNRIIFLKYNGRRNDWEIATSRDTLPVNRIQRKVSQFMIIFRSITTVYLIHLIGSSAELSIDPVQREIESSMDNEILRIAEEKGGHEK